MISKVSQEELTQLRQSLMQEAETNANYLVLTFASAVIASLGLLVNSPAVIIGAMIIAPLMLPLRGLSLAALEGDISLFQKSIISIIVGAIAGIGIAWIVGRIVGIPESEFGPEILSRIRPNLFDLGVAIAAGVVSGFAKIRPEINDALAGTAISVALMPPLCVVGLNLSQGNWSNTGGAFLLYVTNLLGITLACIIVFVLGGYYVENRRVHRALSLTLILTAAIVVPLGLSLWQLIRQAHLTSTLKTILLSRTITVGQHVELVKTEIDWSKQPPAAYLSVVAREPITSKQVLLVEQFVQREMNQEFQLIFLVEQVEEVRAADPETTDTDPSPETTNFQKNPKSPMPPPISTPIPPELVVPPEDEE